MAEIKIENLQKTFPGGARPVLKDITFSVDDSQFVALLGPSGCGKTTLLRIISGLEEQSSGKISVGGRNLDGVHPRDRDMSFVFQNYALYPHFSVRENISLGLRLRKVPETEIDSRLQKITAMLGLSELLERKPKALSGGQRQRVALARALIRNPQVYLLDEPLSNLDAKLRDRTRGELKMLFRSVKGTVVYVTHDQVEAMTMSDKIVILNEGLVQQVGSPEQIYDHPENVFVAGFIGTPQINFLTGKQLSELGLTAEVPGGAADFICGVRPENVSVSAVKKDGWMQGRVLMSELTGAITIITVSAAGAELRFTSGSKWPSGQSDIWFDFDRTRLHFFNVDGTQRL